MVRTGPGIATRLWLAGLALAGIVAGHSLGYAFAVHGASERESLLAASGHDYWAWAVAVAVGAVAAALSGFAVGHARGPVRVSLIATATRLAFVQVTGFTLLEVTERAVGSHHVSHLVVEPAFAFGILAQVLVAIAAALALSLLARTISLLHRPRPRSTQRAFESEPHPARPRAAMRPPADGRGLRSPPEEPAAA